jgi:predicted metal-dependent phosphoesterase TrpH
MKADLHLHTTASDGQLSPREIVQTAANLGLTVIAITDHDTVDGVESALEEAKNFPNLLVIPGVEINTDVPNGEVHVLGYFIDYHDPEFLSTLNELRDARYNRGLKMVAKLADIGIHLDWNSVLEKAGEAPVGRPHIAQALLEYGHISNMKEAFIKYIGRDGIAYVERRKPKSAEAVSIIKRAGGLPFLAHPADIENLGSFIRGLKEVGLIGIEIYYANYTSEKIARLEELAETYNLRKSGGSDYHGFDETVGTDIGNINFPQESIEQFISLAETKGMVFK